MKEKICEYYCYRKTRPTNKINSKKIEKLELIVFDMDGVLTDILSSWKYIHDYFNTSNEKSVNEYLQGKIDDMEFIRRDASLWQKNNKPIKKEKLVEILADVPLMNGAKNCIVLLKQKNIKTAIVSAGLDILAERVANQLGIDHVFSNGIKTDENGFLNNEGIIGVKLMHKDHAVEKLAEQLKLPLSSVATVGNSCFDIPMFEISGLGIAFNPEDDCVKEHADVVVEGKDLNLILPVINEYISIY
jgi:phosphoserine phosphatase